MLAERFQLPEIPPVEPRYNIAPTQSLATVVMTHGHQRQFKLCRWGLIPSWVKDPGVGSGFINAKAETAATKPAFRAAFRRRRCLILADGFYEWQRVGRRKQPFYIHLRDDRPFAFAGLWERWEGPYRQAIDSCTILTTEPNDLLRRLHDRMPVILGPETYDRWLDPTVQEPQVLQPLLRPFPAEHMIAYPVNTRVNNPDNDHPECIKSLPEGKE